MGIRSFTVGVVLGAAGCWAITNGYHQPLIDLAKEKLGHEVPAPAEGEAEPAEAPQPEAAEPEQVTDEPAEAAEEAAPVAEDGPTGEISFSGEASYYAASLNGNPTASGEPYDHSAMTAAHRELPFDTLVRVTNRETGANVVVRINDRGPFADDRVLDVSGAAAELLGMIEAGVITVDVEVLETE